MASSTHWYDFHWNLFIDKIWIYLLDKLEVIRLQRNNRLGLIAEPMIQAIGRSKFEDGLTPRIPGEVLWDCISVQKNLWVTSVLWNLCCLIWKVSIVVWNPKQAVGVAVILWAPCLLEKGSFYVIGKQTSGLLCSQLYVWPKK